VFAPDDTKLFAEARANTSSATTIQPVEYSATIWIFGRKALHHEAQGRMMHRVASGLQGDHAPPYERFEFAKL